MKRALVVVALFFPLAAHAAAPSVRAVGTAASGTIVGVTPGVPSGTATGDLLYMWCETHDDDAPTASGWTEAAHYSGQAGGAGTGSRITLLYKIAESATPARALDVPAEHVFGRIIGITTGTFDASCPVHTFVGESRNVASKSISISGGTTTLNDCLVFYGSSDQVDGSNNMVQCSSMADASLASVTERIDNRRGNGDGGTLCIGTGTLATAGATGTWTVTHVASGVGGEMMAAVCSACPAGGSRRVMTVQ